MGWSLFHGLRLFGGLKASRSLIQQIIDRLHMSDFVTPARVLYMTLSMPIEAGAPGLTWGYEHTWEELACVKSAVAGKPRT